jgi:hypothetical protein
MHTPPTLLHLCERAFVNGFLKSSIRNKSMLHTISNAHGMRLAMDIAYGTRKHILQHQHSVVSVDRSTFGICCETGAKRCSKDQIQVKQASSAHKKVKGEQAGPQQE